MEIKFLYKRLLKMSHKEVAYRFKNSLISLNDKRFKNKMFSYNIINDTGIFLFNNNLNKSINEEMLKKAEKLCLNTFDIFILLPVFKFFNEKFKYWQ